MSNPLSANEHLTDLRALLHGPASDEAWGRLCRALEAIEEPGLLEVALDLSRDALGRRRGDWQRPAQLVPAAWLGATARGEREPRLRLLEALGIERAAFALIPAGRFLMGSPKREVGRFGDERQHEVVLSRDYAMGVFPVTQGLWTQVFGTNPSVFQAGERVQAGQRPVERVNWYEAVAFCNAMSSRDGLEGFYRRGDGGSYTVEDAAEQTKPEIATWEGGGWRLPTEAEWEYGCRGGDARATYNGELQGGGVSQDATLEPLAWYVEKGGKQTREVGLLKANAFGLHDVFGNVWEWCWDFYGPYGEPKDGPSEDPRGPSDGRNRVTRGGCWYSTARWVRAAHRGHGAPDGRDVDRGLRVVRSSPWRLDP